MLKTFEIGKVYGGWLAAQVAPSIGKLISLGDDAGNRFSDQEHNLVFDNSKYFFVTDSYPHNAGLCAPASTKHEVKRAGLNKFSQHQFKKEMGVINKVKEKADIVVFFRYVRPWDHYNDCPVSNMGTTIVFRLDYVKNTMTVALAITKNENFCKATGKAVALERMNRRDSATFNMPSGGIPECGSIAFLASKVRGYLTNSSKGREFLAMYDGKYDRG